MEWLAHPPLKGGGGVSASVRKVEIQASTGKGRIRVSAGKVEI